MKITYIIFKAGYHLLSLEQVLNPLRFFHGRSIFPINSLSTPSVMITMADFAVSSSMRSVQRSKCGRRLRSVRIQPERARRSYKARTTRGVFHHLLMSHCHLQWPVGLDIPPRRQ